MAEPLSAMTVIELTRLFSAQDDRWARILEYARSTRHPLAKQGVAFFKRTWRPVLGDYYENVVSRYAPTTKAPNSVIRVVLDKMADVVYPAARQAGFLDTSFVLPDITIEKQGGAPIVAGHSWMYW